MQTYATIAYLVALALVITGGVLYRVTAPQRKMLVAWSSTVYALLTIATGALVIGPNLSGEPCGSAVLDIALHWDPYAYEPGMQPEIVRCIEVAAAQLTAALTVQIAVSLPMVAVIASAAWGARRRP